MGVRARARVYVHVRARGTESPRAGGARPRLARPQAPKLRSSPLSEGAGSHGERSGWAMTQKAFPFEKALRLRCGSGRAHKKAFLVV